MDRNSNRQSWCYLRAKGIAAVWCQKEWPAKLTYGFLFNYFRLGCNAPNLLVAGEKNTGLTGGGAG